MLKKSVDICLFAFFFIILPNSRDLTRLYKVTLYGSKL